MMSKLFCAAMVFAAASVIPAQAQSVDALGASAESDDPYLWLENVEGEEALNWVRTQNAGSLKQLEADPRFKSMEQEALSVLTSEERLALGQIHNGNVYNFWQDEQHVRGLWRRASVETYRAGAPEWETLIDYDALAKSEARNWVRSSVVCLSPEYVHCMVALSDGGKDATIWREFNTDTKEFVQAGFELPEAKSRVAWLDDGMLIIGTDTGEDSLTDSGYPRRLQRLGRRATVDTAPVIFEASTDDVSVASSVQHDGDDAHIFVLRSVSFFETEIYYALNSDDFEKLPLPLNSNFEGVLDGRAIFRLREEWLYRGKAYPLGAVVAYDLAKKRAELVMAASPSQSITNVSVGETNLIVRYLNDVSGKAARLVREKKNWKLEPIPLPENGVVSTISAGGGTDDALFSFESLTTPDTLYFVTAENEVEKIAQTAPFYDATGVVVEQRFAASADGTKVPYYIMGQDAVLKRGNAPTVQYAYGGFLSPTLPVYYSDPSRPQHGALAGLMWVKRGGVLVLSNIRGGAEYGPRWHQEALKENRQRAFDDFIAISEDLIATGVTSAEKLGAIGRSNGGLLMGALLTQRPDLYAAIDIGVPLFDMKRYNKLLAGASWMGEYGNPDIPEEWAYISQYSPYQKLVADQPYPKVLFYTSTKDDRVHPGHARKAAAKMADLGYDFFYYENIEGGHGGTANQDQLAYRTALEYAYFAKMLMGDGH